MAPGTDNHQPLVCRGLGMFAVPAVPDPKTGKPRLISQVEQEGIPPAQREWYYYMSLDGVRNELEKTARWVEFWRLVHKQQPMDVNAADIVRFLVFGGLPVTAESITSVSRYLVMGWADAAGQTQPEWMRTNQQSDAMELVVPKDGAGYKLTAGVDCPVIIHVPHAGLDWPDDGTAMPDQPDLWDEMKLMADRDVDEIAEMAVALMEGRSDAVKGRGEHTPALFVNKLSRLAMDPERFDNESEEMNQVGMGVIYERSHDGRPLYSTGLSEADSETRKALWYRPYAQALADLVDQVLDRHGRCLILDLHSYSTKPLPCELHQNDERPEVCLGFEPFHDPGVGQAEQVFARHGFRIGRNQPFSGSYVPLTHWRRTPEVKSLMVEIRKDQYLDGDGDTDLDAVIQLAATIVDVIDAWYATPVVGSSTPRTRRHPAER